MASPIDPLLHIDDAVDASAELDRVMLAVAALSPEDRDLLTLFAWEECGYAEIAEALDIPVGTVRSRLHRIVATWRANVSRSQPMNELEMFRDARPAVAPLDDASAAAIHGRH